MNDRFKDWRGLSRFNPLFFLFLILGPMVVLPFLVLSPAIVTFRAGWSKEPHFGWRFSAVFTVALAFLLTLPSSPLFMGLDSPIRPQQQITGGFSWLLEMQRPYMNAAIISLAVALPFSAVSAIDTIIARRG